MQRLSRTAATVVMNNIDVMIIEWAQNEQRTFHILDNNNYIRRSKSTEPIRQTETAFQTVGCKHAYLVTLFYLCCFTTDSVLLYVYVMILCRWFFCCVTSTWICHCFCMCVCVFVAVDAAFVCYHFHKSKMFSFGVDFGQSPLFFQRC